MRVAQPNEYGGADVSYELRRYDASQAAWTVVEAPGWPTRRCIPISSV